MKGLETRSPFTNRSPGSPSVFSMRTAIIASFVESPWFSSSYASASRFLRCPASGVRATDCCGGVGIFCTVWLSIANILSVSCVQTSGRFTESLERQTSDTLTLGHAHVRCRFSAHAHYRGIADIQHLIIYDRSFKFICTSRPSVVSLKGVSYIQVIQF